MKSLLCLFALLFAFTTVASDEAKEIYNCFDKAGKETKLFVFNQDNFRLEQGNVTTHFTNSDRVKEYINDEFKIFYKFEVAKFYRHEWFGTLNYMKHISIFKFDKELRVGSYYTFHKDSFFSFGDEEEINFTCE